MKYESRAVFFGKILGLVAAAFVFGCAPQNNGSTAAKSSVQAAGRMAALSALSVGGGALDNGSDWNCPYEANVTLKDHIAPGGGYDYSGGESFTVCASRTKTPATTFKISGNTRAKAICVYPMRTGYSAGSGSYSAMPGLADNPKCMAITGAPIMVSFKESADINYMVIVDANYAEAMNNCLSSTASCPAHSEGFVQ